MHATVASITTILDDARQAWQLKQAADARQVEQKRREAEERERARLAAEKAIFVERLTALWREITGRPVAIDDADLTYADNRWLWNLTEEYQVGVSGTVRVGDPTHAAYLTLTRHNSLRGTRFTTLVELGDALDQFDRQDAQRRKDAERAQAEDAARTEFLQRRDAWEARKPALPAPSRALLSGHGGAILVPGVYALSLTPFTSRDQQPFDSIGLDQSEVRQLLAVLADGSGLFVDGDFHSRAMILLALNATFWFIGTEQGGVWRTGPLVTIDEGGTTTSALREPLQAWLDFRTAHDAWRAEGEADGFWFD